MPPTESTAFISKDDDRVSEVDIIIEGQLGYQGNPEMAGWPDGSVLGKGIEFCCVCISFVYWVPYFPLLSGYVLILFMIFSHAKICL